MAPLLGAELAAGALGGLGAYIFLARRKAPTKLEKALKVPDLELPAGMSQEAKLPEEDRVVLKEAFLKNPDLKWLATQPGRQDPDPKLLLELVGYMLECQLRFVERYGYLLVSRHATSGAFLGAIGLIPPYSKWWRMKKHYQIAALSLGRHSVPEKLGCYKRYRAYLRQLDFRHQDSMILSQLQEGHWYVPLVGVASASQRSGVGRALMEAVTRLCPRPIYLASPDTACHFFQKVGFILEKRFLMAAEGGNQDFATDVIYYNSMTCQQ
jgi:ribosomal protein S18 acetylase RimI-like enzyme